MFTTNCQVDNASRLIGVNLSLTYETYVAVNICKQIAVHRKDDLK